MINLKMSYSLLRPNIEVSLKNFTQREKTFFVICRRNHEESLGDSVGTLLRIWLQTYMKHILKSWKRDTYVASCNSIL